MAQTSDDEEGGRLTRLLCGTPCRTRGSLKLKQTGGSMFRNRIIASIAFMSLALGGMADANAADTITTARHSEGRFLGAEQVALTTGFFEAEGIGLELLVKTGYPAAQAI